MKVLLTTYVSTIAIGSTASTLLRGQADEVSTPPDFNCFHSALNGDDAKETCSKTKDKNNSKCVWCSMSGAASDSVAGACLSNSEALVTDGKFGLTCPLDIYIEPAKEEVKTNLPDLNCFKAAWNADNAEIACGQSKASDGSACVWCQTNQDKEGVCLSRPEAGMAVGQFNLKCPRDNLQLV